VSISGELKADRQYARWACGVITHLTRRRAPILYSYYPERY
jgi:hypothetical protein